MWLVAGIVLLFAWIAAMTFLYAYWGKSPKDGQKPKEPELPDRFSDPPWGP